MSRGLNGLFHRGSFVESGVVHHNDTLGRKFRKEILLNPGGEDGGIDVGLKQTDCQQRFAKEGADGIRPSFGSPVMLSETSLPPQSIAMGPQRIVGKAAFIQEHDGSRRFFVRFNRFLEGAPCVCARLGMPQAFFYR